MTASSACFGSKMIFTLKLMTWTCKEPLMITQVVKIHQRTLNEHWGYVHTNPGICENAYFYPDLWSLSWKAISKQYGFGVQILFKQRAGRRRRQRERETSKGLDNQNNNFACASRFFGYFFAVVARLRLESTVPNFTFCGRREHKTTIFFFSSWTLM